MGTKVAPAKLRERAMIATANNQSAPPAGDWIAVGTNRRKALLLDIRHEDGEREILTLAELQRRFGQRDAERRPAWWGWIDGDGQEVRDLGDLALVNTVNGARVPLERAPGLLGYDVGPAGVAAIVGAARSAFVMAASFAPAPGTPTHYTSNKRGPLPPGKSQDWARRNLQTFPGAHKPGAGDKPGRDWVISIANYEAELARRDAARVRASVPRRADATDEALAEEALRGAGYRTNGGPR